jgi:thiamine-monophosphate kinase
MNEKEILDRIPKIFPQGEEVLIGPGDDCAVLDFGMDSYFLMAVDQLVSDIHYDRDSTFAAKIAKKLLNRNLSDIAAMGGKPAHALATMALSKKTASDDYWIKEFLESLSKESETWGISVCGGDISSSGSDSDSFSLTITGWVTKESLCLRSSAKPGDLLLATGLFGNSLPSGHHIDFTPRIEQAEFLAGAFTKAMIDVSDGLLIDSARLAEMSGLGLILEPKTIPAREKASLKKRLTDGEDYELLLAVHPEKAKLLLHEWPFDDIPLTEIGLFTSENPGIVRDSNNKVLYDGPESKAGYIHN